MTSRDRDVRVAMRNLLLATNEFAELELGAMPEEAQVGTVSNVFQIEPMTFVQRPHWDTGPDDGAEMVSRVKVIIVTRDESPSERDARAERLWNLANNTLNQQSLAGLTMSAFTGFTGIAEWKPAKHPDRRIEAIFEYRYLLDSSQTFDVTE